MKVIFVLKCQKMEFHCLKKKKMKIKTNKFKNKMKILRNLK